MSSFEFKKRLRFIITLGTGTFGSKGFNQITIEGLRASVSIDKAGGVQMGQLSAKIYGVKDADMRSITTLQWNPRQTIKNTVEVIAIDGKQETLVFAGNIINAWGDYQSPPDVFLFIKASSVYYQQIAAASPLSYQGSIDAAEALRKIATDMGLSFENNGAKAMLNDIYVSNTLVEQARSIATAANFKMCIDDKTMAICPMYGARIGLIPEISAKSGLVGYPTFDGIGVTFVTLFNPSIIFGGQIKLITDLEQASGQWNVASISHRLECEKPNGQWFSTVRGNFGNVELPK